MSVLRYIKLSGVRSKCILEISSKAESDVSNWRI